MKESVMEAVKKFLLEEDGVTMVEYGLIAALISIVVLVTLGLIGDNLLLAYDAICDALSAAVGGAGC
jgi:pilus assembly protein Flp/PilA